MIFIKTKIKNKIYIKFMKTLLLDLNIYNKKIKKKFKKYKIKIVVIFC